MVKTTKKTRQKQRRPIEEVPFYKFEYNFDDLPLDPARQFIGEQISRFNATFQTKILRKFMNRKDFNVRYRIVRLLEFYS